MIEIVPAIDLIDGQAVRLQQGDYEKKNVYDKDPVAVAKRFADMGVRRIHMVDLDGAKAAEPKNIAVLEKVRAEVPLEIEWGGGICNSDALKKVMEAGASYAVIGSIAVKKSELFASWLSEYGERIILGADISNGKIAVKGWTEKTDITISELIRQFSGLKSVICTDISLDGMLQGPNVGLYEKLTKEFPNIEFTASGGISCMKDIMDLDRTGAGKVIVGKALYEGKITAKEVAEWSQNV